MAWSQYHRNNRQYLYASGREFQNQFCQCNYWHFGAKKGHSEHLISECPLKKWCSKAIQIRTGIFFYGFLYVVQCDGSGAVFVVEGDDHFIIVQIDGIYKGIDQHFAVGLLADIQLAEFVKPEGDELRADSGLGNLLIGDLDFQIFFRGFQFLQVGLGGFGEDALLDSV